MEEKDKYQYALGGLVGFVAGILLMVGLENIYSPSIKGRIVIDEDPDFNIPKIMKVYNMGAVADRILVENPNKAGDYLLLSDYLKNFNNKHERNYQKAKIEQLVSQTEGKTIK